jgi:hypothetical protein
VPLKNSSSALSTGSIFIYIDNTVFEVDASFQNSSPTTE